MNKKGFTLIETIMVIAILALLMLILVPNVISLINKNNIKSCQNLEDSIKNAAKVYVANNKYQLGFSCDTAKEITIMLYFILILTISHIMYFYIFKELICIMKISSIISFERFKVFYLFSKIVNI